MRLDRLGAPLPADFYDAPVVKVARALVGCVVSHGGGAGVVVETEAYHHCEPACHAHAGRTARTRVLFGPPGRAYVYRSYGIHALLNAVCEPEDVGAAVLIRALDPIAGVEAMLERRAVAGVEELCSGPGKLTQALGIGLELNDSDLTAGPIRIHPPTDASPEVVASAPRVGITRATDLPWRFSVAGSRLVSRPQPRAAV